MAFIEVGAQTPQGGQFASKAQLKRSWEADPRSVIFVSVGSVLDGGRQGAAFRGPVTCPDDLPSGTRLQLVGPDPFRLRNYYGTVEVKVVKGQRVVKIS